MDAGDSKTWGLFGGSGFIGQHLACSILRRSDNSQVYLLDLADPRESPWKAPLDEFLESGRLHFQHCDVRDPDKFESLPQDFDVLVNLAAVHREPGHTPEEYFDANIKGARNICEFAQRTGCRDIVFSSSISVYGIHDRPADESSETRPYSPYGQSKLEAEKIHATWAKETGGNLVIIRPGVVFGPGESGNVTRLMREMVNRERVIQLSADQPKAGIYIKELVNLIHWLRDTNAGIDGPVNGVSNELLSFNAFGEAFGRLPQASNKELTLPVSLIRAASVAIRPFAGLLSSGSRVHPDRLAKIYRSNDIRPAALQELGYPFEWPLERALEDWLKEGL